MTYPCINASCKGGEDRGGEGGDGDAGGKEGGRAGEHHQIVLLVLTTDGMFVLVTYMYEAWY